MRVNHEPPDKDREDFVKVVTAGDVFDACVRLSKVNQIFSAWTTQPCSVYSLSNEALSKFVKDYPSAAVELQNAFIAVFQRQEKRDEISLSKKKIRRLQEEVNELRVPLPRPRFFRAQSVREFGERLRRNSIFRGAETPLWGSPRSRMESYSRNGGSSKSSSMSHRAGAQQVRFSAVDHQAQAPSDDRIGSSADHRQPSSSRSEPVSEINLTWFHRVRRRVRLARSIGTGDINETGTGRTSDQSRLHERILSWLGRHPREHKHNPVGARRQSVVELSLTQNELFNQAQYITVREVMRHKCEAMRRRSFSNHYFTIPENSNHVTQTVRNRSDSFPRPVVRAKHHVYVKTGKRIQRKRVSL